jgi:hypothetical protein
MPDEDSHLADHARSQAHDSGFRRNDEFLVLQNWRAKSGQGLVPTGC